ncbi:MAG: glucoamylase family protein [Bacteroidota bacterium]
MNRIISFVLTTLVVVVFNSCNKSEPTPDNGAKVITLRDFSLDSQPLNFAYLGTSLTPQLTIKFSEPIDHTSAATAITMAAATLDITFSNGDSTVTAKPTAALRYLTTYAVVISKQLTSTNGKKFDAETVIRLTTQFDPSDKKPRISKDQLLDLVQKQTIKYFYDYAHPTSGMARERYGSGNTVTTGGTGFGIMAVIVGVERNFIPRNDGIQHFNKLVTFLEKADRFHGAWSHWIDGSTGKVIPFSQKDDGGDLVETSFLVQGLITLRQYLQPADTVGNNMINRITKLWTAVEWDWYRKNNENVLYWHWSPDYDWQMNFPMYGYFEEQITYILAAASPTHGIPKIVYTNGYGNGGSIVKNNTYYNTKLPLGSPAPLFWVQYSYLGMDPHFSDDYANYWEQNVAATKIDQAYCIANPKKFYGYSDKCWGLTASDQPSGYSANDPNNDNGTIAPTAALASFPYLPDESTKAMEFFYYTMGDKLWGDYGFYDAFSLSEGWFADSYLAIDQGPIVVMIENYRSGLLWDLFTSAPEIQQAKTVLDLH